MKRILVGGAVIVVLVLIALAALPLVVDLNRHKGAVLERARTVIDRDVDFETIELTVLTGLGARLTGVRVADDPAFSRGDFLTLDQARVRVALLPLLRKEIRVTQLAFVKPRVHLVRNSDGRMNFSTLLRKKPGEERREKKAGALETLGGVMAGGVVVKDGMFVFEDRKAGGGPRNFALDDVDLETEPLAPGKPVEFVLSASFGGSRGQNLTAKGHLGPFGGSGGAPDVPLEIQAILDPVTISAFPGGVRNIAGEASVALDVKGDLSRVVDMRADVKAKGVRVRAGKPEGNALGLSLTCRGDLSLDMSKESLLIKNGAFDLGRGSGTFSGRVEHIRKDPVVNMSAASGNIDPGAVLGMLGIIRAAEPGRFSMAGPMSIRLDAAGPVGGIRIGARADMGSMAVRYGTFLDKPAGSTCTASLRLARTPGQIAIESLDVRVASFEAHGSGKVHKVPSGSRVALDLATGQVSLQEAQRLVPVMQPFSPSGSVRIRAALEAGASLPITLSARAVSDRVALVLAAPKREAAGKKGVLEEPARADLKAAELALDAVRRDRSLSMKGKVSSRGGVFMKIPYSTMNATFALREGRLTVTSFDLDALRGSMKATAAYDLKTRAWSARPVFSGIEAGEILDVITPFKGVFTGSLNGDLALGAVTGAPVMNTLSAKGRLSVGKGQWKNFDLAGHVLGKVLGVPGASMLFGLAPAEIQRYESTRFDAMETEIDIEKRLVTIDTMKMLNISSGRDTDTESYLKGSVSLDTEALDLRGTVVLPRRFSQRIASRADVFSAVMNDSGRIVLPLRIGGTLKRPVPMVEIASLGSSIARYSAARALDRGVERLREKGKLPPATDESRKAIEQTIEGLFRRK